MSVPALTKLPTSVRPLSLPALIVGGALGISLLSFVYILYLEFGAFGAVDLQADELYFFTCAARHSVQGASWINPGCHDNKPPLIYLVQHLVQPHAYLYSPWVGKVAAFSVMAAMFTVVAALAYRLSGRIAAAAALTMLIGALAFNAQMWALKTESVGMLLVLSAFLLLTFRRGATAGGLFVAGLLLGLAVLTKQTNALFLALACVWTLWNHRLTMGWARATGAAFWLGVSGCVPFLAYLAGVYLTGQIDRFMASVLLYPSVYGEGPPQGLHAYLRRGIEVFEKVTAAHEVLFWLFFLGALQTVYLGLWHRPLHGTAAAMRLSVRGLILVAAGASVFVAVISPNFWFYHVIPVWIFLSILAGVAFGDILRELMRGGRTAHASMAGLVLAGCALAGLLSAWNSNGGRGPRHAPEEGRPTIEGVSGQYAYVLGMPWPSLYTDNGLIPATDILFPWALPGMPKNVHYTPPPPDSAKGRWLARMQARNLAQLWEDFRKTPPSYIGLVDGWVKAPGSTHITDVPGMDDYLQAHCVYWKSMRRERMDTLDKPLSIYRCNGAR